MSYMKTGTLPFAYGAIAVVNCSYSLQTGQWQCLPIALPVLRAVYSNMDANSARTVVKPVKDNLSSNKSQAMVPDVFVAYARKYDSDKVQATLVHLTALSLYKHSIMDVI